MYTLFNNDLNDVSSHVSLLDFTLFVRNLKLSPFKNDLDDFFFSFIGEKLVKIGFFSNCSMWGIFEDFFSLKNFWKIFFDTISPIECLVSVTCDLEVSVVDFVPNGCDIGHFDVHNRLFQHFFDWSFKTNYSFIIMLICLLIIKALSWFIKLDILILKA